MSDLQVAGLSVLSAIVLMLIRIPVGIALGLAAVAGIYFTIGEAPAWGLLSSVPFDFAARWTLSSIPMFLLMGYVAYYSRLSEGLFNAARIWLNWMPGGLAVASVGASAAFSAVSGSSLACSAAMGRIVVPQMLAQKYDKGLATGVIAASGTIGSMIPPSIILIIYGIYAEVSIGKLFVAGIFPGILTALVFIAMIVIRVSIKPSIAPRSVKKNTWSERFEALKDTWPTLLLILGVFGGLFGGIFTPTEAGAVGAALAFVIAAIQGRLSKRVIADSLSNALNTTASIFLVVIGAALLTRLLAISGLTEFLASFVVSGDIGSLTLIFGVAVIYLILGMFLDPIGIMLLTLPIFLPLAESLDVNLIWFGILITKLLEIGLITPPVGLNVFVIKGIVGKTVPLEQIFKGVSWFLLADMLTLTLLVSFPIIALFLPSLLQ